jgi:hypothetical protein
VCGSSSEMAGPRAQVEKLVGGGDSSLTMVT